MGSEPRHLMEVNGPASHHFRFITGVTTPGGHWIMGWVGSRAGPGFVERSVNGLSMFVAPNNGSGHCAVFASFAYSAVETQFSGSWKLEMPGVRRRDAGGA
jgi:hypothetical protein